MHGLPHFSSISGVNAPAHDVLSALQGGRIFDALRQALFLAAHYGGKFPEVFAMAAIGMEKMGDDAGGMSHWRDLARSFPWQMSWFAKALSASLKQAGEGNDEYLDEFMAYLRGSFLEPPPLSLLNKLSASGMHINGSCGIHDSALHGWILLPPNASPILKTTLTGRQLPMNITRVQADANGILYKLHAPLPDVPQIFDLEIRDHTGAHIQGSPVVCSSPQSAIAVGKTTVSQQMTVLLPVFDDRVSTLRCLGSVLASLGKNRAKCRVMVVWDHGPDARLLEDLRRLAARGRIQLLITPHNYGFLAAVNFGLSHIPAGDVILLNADTLVHGDWIDRLKKIGERSNAATVTAMGTEAELMTWPRPGNSGKVSDLAAVRLLDQACAKLDENDTAQEIPVGVGFCMLVTRRALNSLHGFDGRAVFRGYGEESEFCLRASGAGFRNYAAPNVFVAHLQGRSFGKSKIALAAQNNKAIKKRNPYYERDYDLFMAADSLRGVREKVSANICLVHASGHLHVRPWHASLNALWSRKAERGLAGAWLFILPCAGNGAVASLKICHDLPLEDMIFYLPQDEEKLGAILRRFSSSSAHALGEEAAKWARRLLPELRVQDMEQPDIPPLPDIDAQDDENKTCRCSLALPPVTLADMGVLFTYADKHPQEAIYVWEMKKYLRDMPSPDNLYELYESQRPEHLFFEKILVCGQCPDLPQWRQWLEKHGCGQLPVYRIDQA